MSELLEQFGWIDLSTIIILVVFLILGLFRGLVWQLTRFMTIILGYILAGFYAKDLSVQMISIWPDSEKFALLASYFAIFIAVAVVLSAIAWMLTGLIKKLKMGSYDRIGGGVVGMATGAGVVVFILAIIYTFAPRHTDLIQAAEKSRTKTSAVTVLNFLNQSLRFSFLEPVLNVLDPQGVGEPTKKQPEEPK